MRGIPADLNVA